MDRLPSDNETSEMMSGTDSVENRFENWHISNNYRSITKSICYSEMEKILS